MKLMAKVRRILADEGVAALLVRVGRKATRVGGSSPPAPPAGNAEALPAPVVQAEAPVERPVEAAPPPTPPPPSPAELLQPIVEEHERLTANFAERARAIPFPGLDRFYWYHTIDLGDGLVTPGQYDFRSCMPAFHFPDDMRGMKVLDVGSATGFFAFECEKRGAQVVSVELPSLQTWDVIPEERARVLQVIADYHGAATLEEAYYRHLRGPFDFCHQQLGSSVRRCYSTIYKLSAEALGERDFDWVILGDILIHLMSPFEALKVVAPLCRGTLVVTADVMGVEESLPLACFFGKMSMATDARSWWGFNRKCITDMLERVGFDEVSVVGKYSEVLRPSWVPFQRWVFHGKRSGGGR